MQDLTGRYPAALAPTSQEAGNLTHPAAAPGLAMTAPGSRPVTPIPGDDESSQVPNPVLPAARIPVSNAPHKPQVAGSSRGGRWDAPNAAAAGGSSIWKETP